ncbi:MAG: hypothetical protein H0T79_00195 [Deltaproteobacteria bacterium]|nr:hypothetical protein [Deltaproteobacteria bacterium]
MRPLQIGLAVSFLSVTVGACAPTVRNGGDDDGVGVDGGGSNNGFPDCDPASGNTCSGNTVVSCNADGTFGSVVTECSDGMTCANATCTNACTADGVDLVYVVSQELDFLSFDPRKLAGDPFTLIGRLACPITRGTIQDPPGTVTPFSMSVDRDGKAWVEYTSGEIFNVSLTDASCTASGYVPEAAGMALFGMGFVTDAPGANTEQLFIAGGGNNADPGGRLAHVDTHGGMYTPVIAGTMAASSDYSAELTGTNEAKLYGFFPNLASPAFVQEIDKATGSLTGTKFNLGTAGLGAQVNAWAFAQWGGKFYVFVTSDGNSTVRVIDRATSMYTLAKQNLPYTIVGAGVSTCAPSVLQ